MNSPSDLRRRGANNAKSPKGKSRTRSRGRDTASAKSPKPTPLSLSFLPDDHPPPPPSGKPITPKEKVGQFLRKRATSLKKLPSQKRFWFTIGTLFGFILPSFLLAPKVLYVTGVTETDLMDDFVTKSLLPFIDDFVPKNPMGEGRIKAPGPGLLLAKEGAKAKHPVVLVPGFITTGLELWEGEACAKKYFRQRMWGSTTMVQNMLQDRDCWGRHLALNPKTGMDPDKIRLRAASGFESADFLIGNYWVWARIIENLAEVGYDQSNMAMHSYDWRLSPKKLEERDQYFSRLKASIEVSVNALGEKAQLVSHSMGSNVIFYFLQWVTQSASKGGGDGGKDWVAKYVAGHVNIAGPLLGTPKALTAILSGEMRDTAEMSPFEPMLQNFFGREKRRDMFSTWGSLWTLMSKGGNAIWDGNLVTFTDGKEGKEAAEATNSALAKFGAAEVRTTEEFIDVLVAWGGGHGHDYHKKIDISFAQSKVGGKQTESSTWHDPLTSPLPYAPEFTHYCMYGIGLDTEHAYYYKKNSNQDGHMPYVLDSSVHDADADVRYGVKMGPGDATVPLVSLGYMCRSGWTKGRKGRKLNPGKSNVVTREYLNGGGLGSDLSDPFRQGPKAADHVDIMGNTQMIEDVVRIATDWHGGIKEDVVHSEIDEIVKRVDVGKK